MTLYHKHLAKLAPDQFGFIANLETLCCELQKDVSFDFPAHCEVKLWLFEFFQIVYINVSYYHILACISKSFLPTLRAVCDTRSRM